MTTATGRSTARTARQWPPSTRWATPRPRSPSPTTGTTGVRGPPTPAAPTRGAASPLCLAALLVLRHPLSVTRQLPGHERDLVGRQQARTARVARGQDGQVQRHFAGRPERGGDRGAVQAVHPDQLGGQLAAGPDHVV